MVGCSRVTDEPRTLAERYSAATVSSHLRAQEGRGDVDYLIAAGWMQDTLGALMYRLRGEYDAARASVPPVGSIPEQRLAAMLALKTLREARDAFGRFAAAVVATRAGFMRPDSEALTIAGQVLEVWLDPLCHHCDGRGFTGGSHRGEKQTICRPCRGSGHRRDWIGRDPEQRRFASRLLLELEQHQLHAERTMQASLHDHD